MLIANAAQVAILHTTEGGM